ncbi:MAG: peptidase M19 [Flammeovirgaceae bacterium]|nr:peptidase M19 [Flammeovirgaceae bacterium]
MRNFLKYFLSLFSLGFLIFFFITGKIADKLLNKVEILNNYKPSQHAKKLHKELIIADLHADNLLWDRDLTSTTSHGMVDLPKLISGNYALQVFDAVVKSPRNLNYLSNSADSDNITLLAAANRWPIQSWFSLYHRAIHQSELLKKAVQKSSRLDFIETQDDLKYFLRLRKNNSYKIGAILSIEGLHALEGNFQNLNGLFEAGFRIMGLVHFFDNKIGGSSAGESKQGLTDFGKRIIREMEKKEIIIDLAHASPKLIEDVLRIAKRPVIFSHTGVKGTFDSPRNLSDAALRSIAKNGGLIGIGFWEEAVGSIHPASIAAAIRYTSDLIGVDHVALGSDFDGAVTTSFDASKIILLTEALIQENFSDNEIKKIMGGNQIKFLRHNLPVK